MLIIRGKILGVKSSQYTDKKSGETRVSHTLQVITQYPASGTGFGDEVRLPPDSTDEQLKLFRDNVGKMIDIAARLFIPKERPQALFTMLRDVKPVILDPSNDAAAAENAA